MTAVRLFCSFGPLEATFWPERKMAEVLSYCFFNDLSNAAFCLSPTLRSRVRRGGYPPPPPAGCHNRSTGSARVNIDILLAKLIKPEKTKILILNWPVTSSVTSQSQILTLFGEFTSAGLSNSVWNLEIDPVVWKISEGPFASPIRTCCHPAPIVARVKSSGFLSSFCKKIALISTMKPDAHAYQPTIYFYWDSVSALHPSLHMYSTRQKYSALLEPPSLVFLRWSPETNANINAKLSAPSPRIHFTHYVIFEIPGYDRSATNNVRVTSCSVDFNTATDAVFKLRSIGLYDIP